jgi:hypothetical protein
MLDAQTKLKLKSMGREQTIGNEIISKSSQFRGFFINQVTHIEKCIDVKIANHFCKEEDLAIEIVDLILGDRFISFESKKSIFEIILKKHHPEEYKINKDNFIRLTKMQTARNRLAHLICAVDAPSIDRFEKDESLGFVKYKEKTEVLYYTKDEQYELLNDTSILLKWLVW